MHPSASARAAVSVVIPNYNSARFLAQAIESALGQTFPPREIVVVDDGSTDDSVDVAMRYGTSVRVIRHAHTGRPGFVRNRGIEVTTGELVAFLDADDYWKPEKIAAQVRLLEHRPDISLVHANMDVVDEEGRYLRPFLLGCAGSRGLSDDDGTSSVEQLVRGDAGIGTPTVLVARSCLDSLGMFDEALPVCEDWHLWVRIARRFKIAYIPESLAVHRKHGQNLGMRWTPDGEVAGVRLWRELLALYPDLGADYGDAIHAKLVMHHYFAALRCVRAGHGLRGLRYLAQAFRINPLRIGPRELWRNVQKFRELRRQARSFRSAGGRRPLPRAAAIGGSRCGS